MTIDPAKFLTWRDKRARFSPFWLHVERYTYVHLESFLHWLRKEPSSSVLAQETLLNGAPSLALLKDMIHFLDRDSPSAFFSRRATACYSACVDHINSPHFLPLLGFDTLTTAGYLLISAAVAARRRRSAMQAQAERGVQLYVPPLYEP